ncbi:MAG: DUF362 domain-containing protein [Planctomycetes bacterium]|nr:DUF362 domain-containing protein [Planctomycetota bacterium]
MPERWTRRQLLLGASAAAIGASAGKLLLEHARPATAPGPSPFPDLPLARARSPVFVGRASSYGEDLSRVLHEGTTALGGFDLRGKSVLLKPNFVEYDPSRPVNTSIPVVIAAIEWARRLGAREIVVGEGPGHRRDIDEILDETSLRDALREHRVRFVDLNHDEIARVPLRTRFMGIDSLFFSKTVLRTDVVVSLPRMKTHHWTGVTLSLKNLFGTVPGVKYGWPKNFLHFHGIGRSISDIASTIRPGFAIVDGIVGMEGNGPIHGSARPAGVLVLGPDPVAVDATATRVMDLLPERIDYLRNLHGDLGVVREDQIDQRGETVASVRTPFAVLDPFRHLRRS